MREAKCMCILHTLHYGQACALKIASEYRATNFRLGFSWSVADCIPKLQNSTREHLRRNTPPLFAEPPLGVQDHSPISRHVPVEVKDRSAPGANQQQYMRRCRKSIVLGAR